MSALIFGVEIYMPIGHIYAKLMSVGTRAENRESVKPGTVPSPPGLHCLQSRCYVSLCTSRATDVLEAPLTKVGITKVITSPCSTKPPRNVPSGPSSSPELQQVYSCKKICPCIKGEPRFSLLAWASTNSSILSAIFSEPESAH